MLANISRIHLYDPITAHARTDYAALRQDLSVQEALDEIRQRGIGERIIYFYVIDAEEKLVGVVPTRRLLTAPTDHRLDEIMIRKVVTISDSATVLEACEFFVMHKFLALPVVNAQKHIQGVVDVSVFTEEVFDLAEREQSDMLFESIGFRLAQVRDASALKAYRYRVPWLLATIASGTLCALLVSFFEMTLAQSLVLAFFLTLVLGLGESVSIQSMTVTIQALRSVPLSKSWYARALRREVTTALLLGLTCGTVVGVIVWTWRSNLPAALAIGTGILLSLISACGFGLSIPTLLHALRLDPKIAAGPVTLALTDIFTLLFYFSMAAMIF